MSNDFYTATGYPAPSADGKSVDMRAELLAISAGFDKMPPLSVNADKLVLVNSGGTGLTVSSVGKYQNNVAWTPVLTCVTPGDLVVVYTTQVGTISRVGQLIKLSWSILTSTFTRSTAAGNLLINGFPNVSGTSFVPMPGGSLSFGGITKATYTQFTPCVNGANVVIFASGTAVASSQVAITDLPSGGTVFLSGTIWYEGAT
jgi:hypothetical protein